MSEKVGEIARESADYRCERCHKATRMAQGELIAPCRYCGYGSYDLLNPNVEPVESDFRPGVPS